MYFDGSDVGLSTNDEDVTAVGVLGDGSILLSTLGQPGVAGVSGATESDVLRFVPSSLGTSTAGVFEMYLDGSDVGLTGGDESIAGLGLGSADAPVLTTIGDVSVPGFSGGPDDAFLCNDAVTGTSSACTFSLFWDGSDSGLDEVVDALALG